MIVISILGPVTLEHILAYPIVLQYFVIIKNLEELYKINFVPTLISMEHR